MFFKKSIWVILILLISACALPPRADPETISHTATISPSPEPTALLSSTPLPSITPTLSPTPSPTIPPPTATPAPVERIAITVAKIFSGEHRASTVISLVNSDGTNFEFPILLAPFYDPFLSAGTYLAWSPDGRFLAFDGADKITPCNSPGTDCFTTNYGTVVADYPQSAIIRQIEDTLTNTSWSPDSQSLVLSINDNLSSRGKTGDLYLLDVSSGKLEQLTSGPASDLYPSWSPDGQIIAFIRYDPGPDCNPFPGVHVLSGKNCHIGSLYMIRPDGSDLQILVESTFIYNQNLSRVGYNAPAWSPDSRWLAFLTNNENDRSYPDISIVNVETGEPQLLVGERGADVNPAWSPDGQMLVYAGKGTSGYSDIFLLDLEENHKINLTNSSSGETVPVWSLTGAHIAFIADSKLWFMNADGTSRVLVDDQYLSVLGKPAWQPSVHP